MTKRTKEEIDVWLNDLYLECIQKGIPHEQRELEVRSKIDDFLKVWSIKPIPEKEYAIRWIKTQCKQESDLLPISIFAFYYDTEFWEIKIPRIYGSVKITPLESLINMPSTLIRYLSYNYYPDMEKYVQHWANCFDLEYGSKEISFIYLDHNAFAANFLFSGIQNLNAATAALLYTSHNNQTIMSIRMALEMFIKSYIAFNDHSKKTYEEKDKQARKLSHDLKKGLEKIQQLTPNKVNKNFFEIIKLFPDINDRYIPQTMSIVDIASCYTLTIHFGAMVTRSITDRNILNQ